MEILIRNRQTILTDYPSNCPWVLISIHEPSLPPADPPADGLQDVLFLTFSDTDASINDVINDSGTVPMNTKQAESILRFFNKWKDRVDSMVCQCDAGISRSSALAAALSIVYEGPRRDQWVFDNPYYKPNMYVYRLILDQAVQQGLI